MHTTLDLRARSAQLEPNRALLHTLAEPSHVADTDVLERVLEADVKVGQERMHRALVLDIARDALRDLDSGRLGEVTRRCGVLVSGVLRGGL